jgi:hypothetical protein
MRNKQTAYENDGNFTMINKYNDGTFKYWYNSDYMSNVYTNLTHYHNVLYDTSLSTVLVSGSNNVNIGSLSGLTEGKLTIVSDNTYPNLLLVDTQAYSATSRYTSTQFCSKYNLTDYWLYASIGSVKLNATNNNYSSKLQFNTNTNSNLTVKLDIDNLGNFYYTSLIQQNWLFDHIHSQYGNLFTIISDNSLTLNPSLHINGECRLSKNLYEPGGYDRYMYTGVAHDLCFNNTSFNIWVTSGTGGNPFVKDYKGMLNEIGNYYANIELNGDYTFGVGVFCTHETSAGLYQMFMLSGGPTGNYSIDEYFGNKLGFVEVGSTPASVDKKINGVNGYIQVYNRGIVQYIPTYNTCPTT